MHTWYRCGGRVHAFATSRVRARGAAEAPHRSACRQASRSSTDTAVRLLEVPEKDVCKNCLRVTQRAQEALLRFRQRSGLA